MNAPSGGDRDDADAGDEVALTRAALQRTRELLHDSTELLRRTRDILLPEDVSVDEDCGASEDRGLG
jgi:hypothetical protein